MDEHREKLGLTKEKRILAEDILKSLFQIEYDGKTSDLASIAGRVGVAQNEAVNIVSRLIEQGYVKRECDLYQLTEKGRELGVMLTRAHRICETYLAQQTGVSASEWHLRAHEMEHRLSSDEINKLADKLGNPRFDPHGDPIPTRDGKVPSIAGVPLTEWEKGKSALIVHVEDEPEVVYARLIAAGITPGIRIKILESSDLFFDVVAEGRPIRLGVEDALQILVAPLSPEMQNEPDFKRLSDLKQGESGIVRGLMPSCVGLERIRLLDLGVVNGSKISYEFASPFGSPITYKVRGTLIALRREQADKILIDVKSPTK